MPPRPTTASSRHPATWSPNLGSVLLKEDISTNSSHTAAMGPSWHRVAPLVASPMMRDQPDRSPTLQRRAQPSFPAGTVTFLFTDIEGSTRLLRQLGKHYARLLADHSRVLADAIEPHGGSIVDTQGDAAFVVFPRARDAV